MFKPVPKKEKKSVSEPLIYVHLAMPRKMTVTS